MSADKDNIFKYLDNERLIGAIFVNSIAAKAFGKPLQPHAERFLKEVKKAFLENYSKFFRVKRTLFRLRSVEMLIDALKVTDRKTRELKVNEVIDFVDLAKVNTKKISQTDREQILRVPISGMGKRSPREEALSKIPYLVKGYQARQFDRDSAKREKHIESMSEYFGAQIKGKHIMYFLCQEVMFMGPTESKLLASKLAKEDLIDDSTPVSGNWKSWVPLNDW